MSKSPPEAQHPAKPAHAGRRNADVTGKDVDEARERAQAIEGHAKASPKWVQSKQTPEDIAKIVLTRHLEELKGNGSPDAEWQIQTLMYRSGVVAHPPTGNAPDFEPSPELLDSSTLEHRPMDNAPRVHWRTGEKLPCIDTTGSLRGTLDDLRVQHCIRYTGKRAAELLVANADIDPIASKAARRVAAHMLEQGDNLPPELSRFVADVLLNRATNPKRPGRRKGQKGNAIRDAAIQSTARLLEEHFGFGPLTRNDTSPKSSICDLLAGALKNLRMAIGYEAVKKIVSKHAGYTRRLR